SDTAVRRFIGKIGVEAIDDLFALREADNLGSGIGPDAGGLDTLRGRVARELEGELVLDRSKLEIDGRDLIEELGLRQGPQLGRILDELLEKVIVDPALNDRATLRLRGRSRAAARVTLDRGDERGAYVLARQALQIDPENAAGQRLAERLEEVLRYRGEQPP